MVLTPNDVGVLVEHTVWRRGKVIEILSPYAIIHFPALAELPTGSATQASRRRAAADQVERAERSRARCASRPGRASRRRSRKRKVKDLQNDLDAAVQWFEADVSGEVRGREVRRRRHAQQARGAGSVRRQLRRGPRRGDGRRRQARRDRRRARRHLPRHQHPVAVRSEGRAQGVREGGRSLDEGARLHAGVRRQPGPARPSRRWPKR